MSADCNGLTLKHCGLVKYQKLFAHVPGFARVGITIKNGLIMTSEKTNIRRFPLTNGQKKWKKKQKTGK